MDIGLVGGPLAGLVLVTTDVPWVGGWLTAGDVGLYVPIHRDPATGTS
ncbi:hypothetical protein [Streptomyces niveus]